MENQLGDALNPKRNGRRIVLFPVPLQGHINPMLQLANILYSKGFNITIIHTTLNTPNKSNYPNFTFCPISVEHLIVGSNGSTTREIENVIDFIRTVNEKLVQPFSHCLAGLLSESEEPIVCLITDAHWHFTQTIADSFKLPRIVLRTSGVCSTLVFAAFPILEKCYRTKKDDSNLEDQVPELPQIKFKDISAILTSNADNLLKSLDKMTKGIQASSGLIWNSFIELEPEIAQFQQDFPIPNFPIGPFNKYFPASSSSLLVQDQSSILWLDKQNPRSVIYVSFGSIAGIEEADFLEMAWGIANSMQPFLWVVRTGVVRGSEWLEFLPDGFLKGLGGRGYIVKWAPQQEVLSHSAIGGFWTHSGWNSTLEGICAGVPMICSPSFGDQLVNARYVSDVWRVGVQLENRIERGEIEGAIRRVMVDGDGEREEMRDRAVCLKEKANNCLKQGGSSYQSLENLINHILSF